MIGDLARILGPENRGKLTSFLLWALAYGVLQGVSVTFLVPIARAIGTGDWADATRWLLLLLVPAAGACVANYVQTMKGFRVALLLLATMHQRVGDHLVTLPLVWFGKDTVGRVSLLAGKGTIAVGGAAAHLLTPLAVGVVTPATIVACLLVLEPWLGVTLLVCAPLIYLASR